MKVLSTLCFLSAAFNSVNVGCFVRRIALLLGIANFIVPLCGYESSLLLGMQPSLDPMLCASSCPFIL